MFRTIGLSCLTWLATAPLLAQQAPPSALPDYEPEPATQQAFEYIEEPLFLDTFVDNRLVLRPIQRAAETGPFIGVSASPVPAVLRDQLQLKPGIGLVVDFVTPQGPAATAGLRQSDVIEKLDDQLLVNAQQLAVLVRGRKPGDAITFSVIRAAKPTKVEVTVGEGDVPPLDDLLSQDGNVKFRNLLKPSSSLPQWKRSAPGGGVGGADPFILRSHPNTTFDLSWSDKEHRFQITQDAGGRRVVARDKTGKQIYDGPINTDQEIEKLPAEIRQKVKKVEARWKPPATSPIAKPPEGGV